LSSTKKKPYIIHKNYGWAEFATSHLRKLSTQSAPKRGKRGKREKKGKRGRYTTFEINSIIINPNNPH